MTSINFAKLLADERKKARLAQANGEPKKSAIPELSLSHIVSFFSSFPHLPSFYSFFILHLSPYYHLIYSLILLLYLMFYLFILSFIPSSFFLPFSYYLSTLILLPFIHFMIV